MFAVGAGTPASLWRTANRPPPGGPNEGVTMNPVVAFVFSLLVIAFAGRRLAAAGRALGVPAALVTFLESVALG